MIGQVVCVTSVSRSCANRCQSWTIFMWLSIDHRLANTNRFQLTNFIDWYQLIDWFSNHRFPSIGYSGTYLKQEKSLIVEHDFFWKIVPNWVYFGQREDLSKKEKWCRNQAIKNGLNKAILLLSINEAFCFQDKTLCLSSNQDLILYEGDSNF